MRLARYLDLPKASFDGFMEWSLDLRRQVGIPHTLAELGVKESHLDRFAEMAAADPTAGGNPVKAGVPEMRRMYEAAVAGRRSVRASPGRRPVRLPGTSMPPAQPRRATVPVIQVVNARRYCASPRG